VWVEYSGKTCPLTPLENHFRHLAASQGFSGGFIEHYLVRVIYPDHLNAALQWLLGAVVIFVNLAVYFFVFYRRKKRCRQVD
jgi:phosphotransferase system  glucose/maltose/N-acetylglucosamine-specific IIC component